MRILYIILIVIGVFFTFLFIRKMYLIHKEQEVRLTFFPLCWETLKSFWNNTYLRFIVRKALFYVLVFMIAITLAFWIPRLLPGDPLAQLLQPPPDLTGDDLIEWLAQADVLREYLRLPPTPPAEAYFGFLGDLFRGNLGYSYINLVPVADIVRPRLIFSLMVVLPAVSLTFYLGNSVGALIGYKRKWYNNLLFE